MTLQTPISRRGARRVGMLGDLTPLEQLAVTCLRQWAPDAASQTRLLASLAEGLGAARGRSALGAMNEMMEIVAQYGRRPFACHGVGAEVLGADEAVFAALIEASLDAEPEEASLFAGLIVRPDLARPLAGLAMELAIGLAALLRAVPPNAPRLSLVGGQGASQPH